MSLIPSISFIENNVGSNPVKQNIRNRIGIVSGFSRGSTTPTFITGDTFFANNYGYDTSIGSLAYQAARDQGAEDFLCVRVLGNAKPASGNVSFTGIANKANTLQFNINFIGNVVKINEFDETITTQADSPYTGTVSGRYFFKVFTSLTADNVLLKYQFVNLASGDVAPTNWSTASEVQVDLTPTTFPASITITNGVVLKIGTIGQTSALNLSVNDEFKVRVNTYNYTMVVNGGDIPYQIATSFISSFSAVDLLGDITLNSEANGVVFNLDSTNSDIVGNIGNRFHYSFNLSNLDILKGDVAATVYTANKLQYITAITSHSSQSNADANTSGTDVLNEVTTAINNNTAYPFDSALYYRITFTPGVSTTPTLGNNTFMTGGEDGPRQAYRDFYSINGTPLLRLQANYVGDYGNNIKVTLYPDSNNKFRLVVSDLNADNYNPRLQSERYTLDFNNLDSNGLLNQLKESIYINGVFLPKFTDPVGYDTSLVNQSPVRLAPADSTIIDVDNIAHTTYYGPAKLVDVSLELGYDGPAVTDNDYVKAINSLTGYPVHILITPGVISNAVQQHLITHCENSKDKDGLNIAILAAKPRLSPNAAKSESLGFNTKRAVKVVGWCTYAGQPNATRFGLSADALYAGKLGRIPFYVSPHARGSSGSVNNIIEIDTFSNSNSQALQLYTDAKLEVLHVDSGSQAYFFTTGNTLSSDPAWEKIYVRRTYDVIRQDLYDLLSYYIGEPHTPKLRVQIQVAVETYLRQLSVNGQIANYGNVTVSSQNNPAELYINGQLNVSFNFLPLYAVDYIQISIVRNSQDGYAVTGT